MTELAEAAVPDRARPTYAEDTLAAKADLELAGLECTDARERWLGLELEVRRFDEENRGEGAEILQQRARLRRLLSEAEVEFRRAEDALRDAGARAGELVSRDEYRFRAEQLHVMYATRAAEDEARAAASRKRGRLLRGRFGKR